jgi:hypothetical protein
MAKGRKTGGRQKGTPNKATAAAKDAAMRFLSARTDAEIEGLWGEVKAESPSKAFGFWLGAQEFITPKLGRTEVTGQDGGPVEFVVRDLGREKPD